MIEENSENISRESIDGEEESKNDEAEIVAIYEVERMVSFSKNIPRYFIPSTFYILSHNFIISIATSFWTSKVLIFRELSYQILVI